MASRYIQIQGTAEFKAVARALKEAGKGKLAREMAKGLRKGADPLVKDAQRRVRSLPITGARGGASARAARAAIALGKRKKPSERLKRKAHKGSGLRASVARATSAKVSTSARSASLSVRAQSAKMPRDQRKLPKHLNTGRWRHPVFGNRNNWATQSAPPAWFDDAAQAQGPKVRDNAMQVVERYLDQIV